MLGSPFFPDSGCSYTLHGHDSCSLPTHNEPSRNNIWAKVMALMPFAPVVQKPLDAEKDQNIMESTPLRARVAVRHLNLSVKSASKCLGRGQTSSKAIGEECNASSMKTLFGVLATEIRPGHRSCRCFLVEVVARRTLGIAFCSEAAEYIGGS